MYRTDEWCLMKSGLFYSGKESTRLRMIFCEDCNVNGSHNHWGGFPQCPKSASLAFFRWDTILCQALDLSLKWMGCDNRRTQPLVTNTFSFPDPLWCENKALYRPSETGTLNCVSVCVCVCLQVVYSPCKLTEANNLFTWQISYVNLQMN